MCVHVCICVCTCVNGGIIHSKLSTITKQFFFHKMLETSCLEAVLIGNYLLILSYLQPTLTALRLGREYIAFLWGDMSVSVACRSAGIVT